MSDWPRVRMALLETVRVRAGRVPLWPLHEERVRRSAAALGYSVPAELVAPTGGSDRICRIEYASRERVSVTDRQVEEVTGLRLRTAPVPHRGYRHKTTDREWLDAARLHAATKGADDVLFLSEEGTVAESSIWSIFWWEGDQLAAPPLDSGVLPGVARARLADLVGGLREAGLPGVELAAHRGFAANAARGIVPLAEVDGIQVVPNGRTERLMEEFWP